MKPTYDPSTPPRVLLYSRVSTPDQSVEQQHLELREYVALLKAEGQLPPDAFVEHLDEIAVSGSVPFANRPKGKVGLALLRSGDHLVCTKLDRAFRSASDCLNTAESLDERGVMVHLLNLRVGKTACINRGMGKFMMTVLAAVAEVERELISERTRDQKRARKLQGFHIGGSTPWTHNRMTDGRLVENPSRTALVNEMRAWRADGVALREIEARCEERKEKISRTTIRSLTDSVASPLARRRGRRKKFPLGAWDLTRNPDA